MLRFQALRSRLSLGGGLLPWFALRLLWVVWVFLGSRSQALKPLDPKPQTLRTPRLCWVEGPQGVGPARYT